jgi:hypothetical protein
MLEKIKQYFTKETGFYTGLFSILAIGGWIHNGLYNSHFIIGDLMNIYAWIVGQMHLKYGVDSLLNSNKGDMPK